MTKTNSTGTPRFTITTTTGLVVTGVVQGCGGPIHGRGSLERLRSCAERAAEGESISIYEPEPGHALVYPDYCASGNGPGLPVNLVGATIEVAS